jgi:hypothetical protein
MGEIRTFRIITIVRKNNLCINWKKNTSTKNNSKNEDKKNDDDRESE